MNQETFYQALCRLSDRDISPELFKELEEHLLASKDARNDYREFIHLQSVIGLEVGIQQRRGHVVPIERIISRQKRRTLKIVALSTAAIFLVGLVAMSLLSLSNDEPPLVFKVSPDTQFELIHGDTSDALEGKVLDDGSRLILKQGIVELSFASGVKSVIIAPAELTLHNESELFL
jgi:hypothetical protein